MINKLIKSFNDPIKAYKVLKRILKGKWYKFWYQTILKRAEFGENFVANGTLSIHGPGKVVFGDNVKIGMTVTPWTYNKDAIITIGDDVFLNGTRFACAEKIKIGHDCILADRRIMDTDFHGTDPNHRDVVKSAPIYIENDVWITIQCVILKSVVIGHGSTITPNSVVSSSVPPMVIAGGNPTKVIKKLEG